MRDRIIDDRQGRPGACAGFARGITAGLLVMATATSLPGCSAVQRFLGEDREASPASAPVRPASPLETAAAPSSPSPVAPPAADEARPGSAATTPSAAATAPVAEPAMAGRPAARPPAPAAAPASPAPATSRPVPRAAARSAGPPSVSVRPAAAGRYAVQVGAFRSAVSAQAVRDQLAAELERAPELAGLLGSLRVVTRAGLHRVWVGDAADAAEGGALAARIRAATGRDTFVARP